MTELKEKLTEAINAKKNDITTYVWKLAKKSDKTQEEIRLVDATPEQLNQFYAHCNSMLYSKSKSNPGRYVLLNIIKDQRDKCNVEIFLRKLESGALCKDGAPYPRYLYLQDLRSFMNANKDQFPTNELKNISIATCTNGLPREFARIDIQTVIDACLDSLGFFENKHITFTFIINLGVCLTKNELKKFNAKDLEGNKISKLTQIKQYLGLKDWVDLQVKPSGLNLEELRAMLILRPKKYSELTTDQLVVLRNKVLFRLENDVNKNIEFWETLKKQIEKVAEVNNITLNAETN
jgi:hypothetical protein